MGGIMKFLQLVKNDFGVRAQPLVSIEPEHIIINELHLLLGICDKLLRNLILDTKTLDDKNAFMVRSQIS